MYYVIDEGFGDLVIKRGKKKVVEHEGSMLVGSFRTRREALKHCCKYILEILEKDDDITYFPIGVCDKSKSVEDAIGKATQDKR